MPRIRLFSALASALFLASTAAHALSYPIDVLYNVTGNDKASARAAWRGAELAALELQQMNIPVSLMLYDGQSKRNMDHAIASMRAKNDQAPVMIALTRSDNLLTTASPITQSNKIFISTCAASESSQQALGDHYIMTAFTLEQEAKKGAHFLHDTMHQNSAFVLVEPSETNQTLARAFSNTFKNLGGSPYVIQVTQRITPSHAQKIAATLQAKISDSAHTVIYLATNTKSAANLLAALREQDLVNTVMTSARFSPSHIRKFKNKHVAPFFYTSHTFLASSKPSTELIQFRQAYRNHYHTDPVLPETALGYDAVMLAGYAITHSQHYNGKELSQALHKLTHAPMVTGHLNLSNSKEPVDKIAIIGIGNDLKAYQVDRGNA